MENPPGPPEIKDSTERALVPPLISPSPTNTAIYLQDSCCKHRYIRTKGTSPHVEIPERLRAVKLGLAAAVARLEELGPPTKSATSETSPSRVGNNDAVEDDLTTALGRMNLASGTLKSNELLVPVIHSSASVNISTHRATNFIHDNIYLDGLQVWIRESQDKIAKGFSEIPKRLPQMDLYLCPGSIDAIQGAIGTICEAVDNVIQSTRVSSPSQAKIVTEPVASMSVEASRAFVAIRPPGHHCNEDTPSGFCFVNNVLIGAAHAHLHHNVNRVVILDIDLHHGNGTQSIAWQINEGGYLHSLISEDSDTTLPSKPRLRIYYGSIHDILSYPCEDGNASMVQAASVSIHDSHGQHIENVHLQLYKSNEHFWEVLYKNKYSRLLSKAKDFIESTGSEDDVMVFISCGFDACEHEYRYMSRHNRKVPASFYHRFTRDACAFADQYARGRIVSVLEGGYSDRALTSGAMAHLSGLTSRSGIGGEIDEDWWSVGNLSKLEQATKKGRGARDIPSAQNSGSNEAWIERTMAIFSILDNGDPSRRVITPSSSRDAMSAPPTSMTLRERKKPISSAETSPAPSPSRMKTTGSVRGGKKRVSDAARDNRKQKSSSSSDETNVKESSLDEPSPDVEHKKLPRVILRLGPPPDLAPS